MDDTGPVETAPQPPETEEASTSAEEAQTDPGAQQTENGNGRSETPHEREVEEERENASNHETEVPPNTVAEETVEHLVESSEVEGGEVTVADVQNEGAGERSDGQREQQIAEVSEAAANEKEPSPVAERGEEESGPDGAVGGRDDEQLTTQPQEESATPKEAKRKDKEKKKAEKKAKKKSKQTPSSPPKLRKPSHRNQMEEILIALFQPFDPESSGSVDSTTFWKIIESEDLNLQLSSQELAALKEVVIPDRSDSISYAEFAAQASDIITSLYQDKPSSDDYRVRMATPSGNRVLSYDKQTGQFQDLVEEGVDPFEENIQSLFHTANTQGRGYITREEFIALFQLEQLQLLNEEDFSQMIQYYDQVVPEGQARYEEFYPLGKELILRLYRNQDTSDSEWIQLHSEHLGRYQLNKYTGEIHRDTAVTGLQTSHTQPRMELINQAYRQAEEATFEKEQYKEHNRDLQNQLRLAREDQEQVAIQLDQTGHILDEANAEIRQKEGELGGLKLLLAGKEHEIEDLKTQFAETEVVKERLDMLEQELESAQGEVDARDQSMVVRDSSMVTLQKQSLGVIDKLKTAWATIDAKDSEIRKLHHQVKTEQDRMKSYEEKTPLLKAKVSELESELKRVNLSLEEKTSALTATRKHLKNARERNMELEKVSEKATATQDKLRGAESEIKTLKSLLTSKTAIVERRKKDLAETRARLIDLEEKDNRRSVILADVLERTARQYQNNLMMGGARGADVTTFDTQLSMSTSQYMNPSIQRPLSAPSVPPDVPAAHSLSPHPHHTHHHTQTLPPTHSPKVMRTYTVPRSMSHPSRPAPTKPTYRGQPRSRVISKLPPIKRRPTLTKASSFCVPTEKEVLEEQRRRDREQLVQHSQSNPQCSCQLCMVGGATEESLEDGVRLDEQVVLAGLAGTQERALASQINTGQRVLVTMKRSEFDLEPQQYTGIVKYVGKIDSEYIDNRVYVGVKLDEPVGDTDGLVKGKRYFYSPAKHGKVVRLSSVVAVLPNKSVAYKPIKMASTISPYTAGQTSHKRARVKVT